MSVERIFVAPKAKAGQIEVQLVRLVEGKGIEGDRNFGLHKYPGQNLTLIEAEELEAFAAEQHCAVDLARSRRNVVMRGVRLNDLVGREFELGTARLRGVELCEPCSGFGKGFATPEWKAHKVVKRFLHRAGLRADVIVSGEFGVSDALRALTPD